MEANHIDLKEVAKDNEYFRKVIFTAAHSQLVVMALRPGEEIGAEVHEADQFIYAVKGEGRAAIEGTVAPFAKGDALCIPAGKLHNVWNSGEESLKLFTVYSPPQHAAGAVQRVKADARDESPAAAIG